eukprot:8007346-Alexandrium_andersonii.AAC.1
MMKYIVRHGLDAAHQKQVTVCKDQYDAALTSQFAAMKSSDLGAKQFLDCYKDLSPLVLPAAELARCLPRLDSGDWSGVGTQVATLVKEATIGNRLFSI